MNARLHFVVEGQTEEMFVNEVLRHHLSRYHVWADVRMIQTGKTAARRHKGGLLDFGHLAKDVTRWMKEDQGDDARFTTMVDLYRYPDNAPGYPEAVSLQPYERVRRLEAGLAAHIDSPRFVPHIQLHEFETLLYADVSKWNNLLPDSAEGIRDLSDSVDGFGNIELINDGEKTAPSKRILQRIPAYDKVVWGSLLALEIGLEAIRDKCAHFSEWLTKLENLR